MTGFEPATAGLTVLCSTNELHNHGAISTISRQNPYTEHTVVTLHAETLRAAGQDDVHRLSHTIVPKTKSPFDGSPKGLVRAGFIMNLRAHDTSGVEVHATTIRKLRATAVRGAQEFGGLGAFDHD